MFQIEHFVDPTFCCEMQTNKSMTYIIPAVFNIRNMDYDTKLEQDQYFLTLIWIVPNFEHNWDNILCHRLVCVVISK